MDKRKCGWDIADGMLCYRPKAKNSNWCAYHLEELIQLESNSQNPIETKGE